MGSGTTRCTAAHRDKFRLVPGGAGEAHEIIHEVLSNPSQAQKLDRIGHCSGWDALAGAAAVLRPN